MPSLSGNGIFYDFVTYVAILAAVLTTSIPIMYSRVRWEKTIVGRLFMFKTISISFAVDSAVYFRIADPSLPVRNVITLFMYGMLTLSAGLFLKMMFDLQSNPRFNEKELLDGHAKDTR